MVKKKYLDGQIVKRKEKSSFTIQEIKGINTKALTANFEDEAVIQNILQTFMKTFSDVQAKFSDTLTIETLRKNIHSLKGSSGNLCMEELFECSRLIHDNNDDTFLMQHLDELQTQLERVLRNIKNYLPKQEEFFNSIDKDEALNLLKELSKILETGSFISVEDKKNFASALVTLSDQEHARAVLELIGTYKFDEAKKQVETLLEE